MRGSQTPFDSGNKRRDQLQINKLKRRGGGRGGGGQVEDQEAKLLISQMFQKPNVK